MLSARLIKKLEGIDKCSRQGHKVRNLFNIMTNNPELWLQAYANVYPNRGSLTEGVDGITVDGFCEDRVANTLKLLKEGRYQCNPSRRAYLHKPNGKRRPLGIQSGDDKLTQEVTRLLLERVYEPIFSETSHGFRTGRSCHTALDEIRKVWTGARWLINVDVAGYFDNIDHRLLLTLLERKIDDRKFIGLIKSMLQAGYLEDWQFHRTYSGMPQGSGCSPILANIYLHELDKFMEEMKEDFNQGLKRRGHPPYHALGREIRQLRQEVDALGSKSAEAQELKDRIKQFGQARGYGNYDRLESIHRPELLYLSDYEIIGTYNAELRGLANYYALAKDAKQKLNRLEYLTQGSLLKTLANKHQIKVAEMACRLKQGEDYVHRNIVNGKVREIKVFKIKDLKPEPKAWEKADLLPNTYAYAEQTEILRRMAARQCEYCGKEDGYFEVHHVRKLADLKDGKERWQKLMSARRRKTMVLCVECHDLLHAGKLPSWRASMYERSGEPCAVKAASTVRRGAHACTPEV